MKKRWWMATSHRHQNRPPLHLITVPPSCQRTIPLWKNLVTLTLTLSLSLPLLLTVILETLSLHLYLNHWRIPKERVPPRGRKSLLQVRRGEEIPVVIDRRHDRCHPLPVKVAGCHSSRVADDSSTMWRILALNLIEKKTSLGESWKSRSLGWPP